MPTTAVANVVFPGSVWMGATPHSRCVERARGPVSALTSIGLLLLTFQTAKKILRYTVGTLALIRQNIHLLSLIEGSNSSLSYDGKGNLISQKYGRGSPIRDFCVDYLVNTEEVVAVTCDLCKAEKVETEDGFCSYLLFLYYSGSLYKHLLSPRVRLQVQHCAGRLLLRPRLW